VGRATAAFCGILLLTCLAAGLTETALAIGHQGGIVDDTMLRPPVRSASPSPHPTATPSPSPSATPIATPLATPAQSAPTATTSSFVHLRASNSTSSSILSNLNGGTVVQLLSGGDSLWQEVEYDGTVGYIFKSYLTY